jgi:hypothetical protein
VGERRRWGHVATRRRSKRAWGYAVRIRLACHPFAIVSCLLSRTPLLVLDGFVEEIVGCVRHQRLVADVC